MKYYIDNKKNNTNYTKEFKTSADIRHWIINNLDLSLEWNFKKISSRTIKKTKLKTIELHEDTTAIFTGSKELKQFIFDRCECDIENTIRCEFHIDYLSDKKDLNINKNIKNELAILVSELSDRNINYLTILKKG